ncbi:DUF3833 family protein [Sphingomonas lutea]|nr:DUF3833 family protein [Sphingomonas lutea]
MRRTAAALLPLALAGCMDDSTPAAAPGATLDPVAFFAGRSMGEGTLDLLVGKSEQIRVRSLGRRDGNGGLVLVQEIRQGDNAPRRRSWTLRPNGAGRYTGELTDARGPVDVEVAGGLARIRYTMKNGMAVDQTLALQPDGRTLRNSFNVRKFGIQVARLDEVIRKLD